MSNSIEAINKALYRNIKSGNQYNKYFSAAPCKPTYLGDGVTSFGLQKIKELAKQYQDQTTGIAKVLKATTIPATVLNIKNFLFNHLQYNADGWEQHLKSPNCAWQSRQTGLDCKSYSLFASSILLNLGINHKLRKITQPGSPERWSHVYVVVPHNGKELIIDATIPYNYEVAKVKQEDLNMETKLSYYGLNGAMRSVTENPKSQEILAALDNFQNWLDSLERKGVAKAITDTIWFEVKKYLDKGVEPKVRIEDSFILINDKRIDFGVTKANGLGFWEDLVETGVGAGTGDPFSFISGITGLFGDLFGPKETIDQAKERARQRSIEPFKQFIQSQIQSANSQNLGQIVTELDKRLSVHINHEKAWEQKAKAKNTKAAAREIYTSLEGILKGLRSQMTGKMQSTQKSGTFTVKNVYDGKDITQQISYLEYTNVLPKTNTISNPIGNGNNANDLNNFGSGDKNPNPDGGMSTGAIVGLSLAGLAIAYFGAKKMNII